MLTGVYDDRILRGEEFYLWKTLGACGTNLSLLANFLESTWTGASANLVPADQSWVIGSVGSALRAVGRLADAAEPTRVSAAACVENEDWWNSSAAYVNLSEVFLALGKLRDAMAAARQSVAYADRSGGIFPRVASRTTVATALHQSGDFGEALRIFAEAEGLQAEQEPKYPIMFSVHGYRYCDFLLSQGQSGEVVRRASQTLEWAEDDLVSVGLDHVLLGRALAPASAEATNHLDQAVSFLRRAGVLDMLPLGLLARGKPSDLDEVCRIATRSGMRLHLTDYHLASARLALSNGDRDQARAHVEKAAALVNETGYHRRDREVAELRSKVNA